MDNIEEMLNELQELTASEIKVSDIAKELEITDIQVMGMVNMLKEQGLNIVVVKKDDGIYLLNQGERKYQNDYKYSFSSGNDHIMKFLVISDTRFGSKFAQKTILNELYQRAHDQGINHVIHTGNITEGLYKMSDNMIDTLIEKDTYSQAKYVIQNYPYIEGMKTYFITGKKDQAHLKENKIDIGNKISNERDDLIYIGNKRCTVYVDNVEMLLLNRNQRKTYTQSYRAQKLIDAMRSEDKPDILLYGGLLQSEKYMYRDVRVMSIPSMCATTWEMEEKEYSNTVGAWILEIETDKKGNLKSMRAYDDIYYVTDNSDFEKAKTLKIVRTRK